MGALTDDGEVAGLKFLTAQGGTISAIYVALCTSATTPDDATAGTAVSGGSYARQPASFSTPASGSCSNSADLVFTGMPACTVAYVELYTASTSGTRIWYGPLASSKTVSAGDTFTIPSGSLVLSLD
jgi:hypothetical protein